MSVDTARDAMIAVAHSTPELVVIDIDKCDIYAPLLVNQLRGDTRVPSSAVIVAFGRVLTDGLKAQLIEAGATDVLSWYRAEDFPS
ncbi:hypothetical protein V8J82_14455 [Gymnodinialimonas sp. 2305UL16-5]|uniref:hypothetical protein n=1 Tax=Gymnodinialimonas mytili TaxID=3126503 RepID=UPI00309C6D54